VQCRRRRRTRSINVRVRYRIVPGSSVAPRWNSSTHFDRVHIPKQPIVCIHTHSPSSRFVTAMDITDEELEVLEELSAQVEAAAAAAAAATGGPSPNEDALEEADVDVDEGDDEVVNGAKSDKSSNGVSTVASSTAASTPSKPLKPSTLQQLGVAMPLLLNSAVAAAILKQSTVNELLKQCIAAGRDATSTKEDGASKEKSTKSADGHAHAVLHDHDDHLRTAPYHIEADNRSACAACLKQALIPAHSQAHHLQPQSLYQLEYALKHQALITFMQARWTKGELLYARSTLVQWCCNPILISLLSKLSLLAPVPTRATGAVSSAATELSVLAQLLLNYLGEPPTAAAAAAASTTASSAATTAPDPRFLTILHEAMLHQTPFSIDLSSSEEQFYTRISALCLAASASSGSAAPLQLRETLLKFWLGRGSVQQSFDALNYLIRDCASTPQPLQLTAFLAQWQQLMRSRKKTLLRVSRLKHLSEIASCARKVQLICSSTPTVAPPAPTKRHGRTWNFEADSGWMRLDERVCQILEEAYQANKSSVEYTIDAQGYTYRADLVKMTQRNLQTGRERPLRCLLALMIKEKGGRVTQTVEINMPHDTMIRELRSELANYLRWDEKLLRMTYAGKVLRKADYENVSIRDAIVPLGAEPLTVTKLHKGDLEELCTFTITGPKPVRQPLYECATCMLGFVMCAVCAAQCHRGHDTRLLTDVDGAADGTSVGFCCCGAGAGSDVVPCKSLEELPEDAETFYGPHMSSSTRGDYLYIISTEHGLLKIGTGLHHTTTGKLYGQNTHMSAHAGAQLACVRMDGGREVLLMRTPVLGADTLLHIDPETLFFTHHRTLLSAANVASMSPDSDTIPTSFVAGAHSWQLEYSLKTDGDSTDTAEAAPVLGEDGEPISITGWTSIPPALLSQVKLTLCTNWQYGHVCWLKPGDSSLMSVVLEEEGMILRLPSKLGVKRCRMRLKHHEHIMPIFTQEQQLYAMQLTPPTEDGESGATVPVHPVSPSSRRREYGLTLDVYDMPTSSAPTPPTPYCRSCSSVMQPSSSAIPPPLAALSFATAVPLTSAAFICPRCDGVSGSLALVDDEKKSSEPATASKNVFVSLSPDSPTTMQSQMIESSVEAGMDVQLHHVTSESGPSLPPSLPASPPSNPMPYSNAAAMHATLTTPLPPTADSTAASSSPPVPSPDMNVEFDVGDMYEEIPRSSTTPSFSSSPSMSPMSVEYASDAIPAGDAFFEHAWSNATALPTSTTDDIHPTPLFVNFSRAIFVRRTTLEASVGLYKAMANESAAIGAKKHICDGCGGTGVPVCLPDGSVTPASSLLSRLSVCLDRACAENNVCLCKWCALMGNWQSKSHRASHAMQPVATDVDDTTTSAVSSPMSPGASTFPSTYQQLHMGEFASYIDFARGVLVILRSPSQVSSSTSHRESCLVFDFHTGVCTAKQILIKTRGDCYTQVANGVWAFATAGARLERWECLEEAHEVTPPDQLRGDTIHAIDAATVMLRELPAIASSISVMTSSLQQLYQLLEFVMAESNVDMRKSYPHLAQMLLYQLRAQLVNWNVQTNPLHSGQAAANTTIDGLSANVPSVASQVAVLLESALGISGAIDSMPAGRRDYRQTRSPARRTLFTDAHEASPAVASAWPAYLQSQAVEILVEGFELFYPTTKQRITLVATLMDASSTAGVSGLSIACAPQLLRQLAERYRLGYMGLKPVKSIVDGVGQADANDHTFLASSVQNMIHTWIELMSEHDMTQAETRRTYDRRDQHLTTPHVLTYEMQLIQLVTYLNQPHIVQSSSTHAASRQIRSANSAYIKLATLVLEHALEVTQAAEASQKRQQLENDRGTSFVDANVALAVDASIAESTLQFLGESSIGELLSWILLSLPELQIEKLAISTSPTQAQLITQFLKSSISLMCCLSALQTRALKVSRVDQSDSLLADQLTPNHTRIRLGDTRRKIIALRQSGQLLTLRSLQIASGTAAAAVRGVAVRRSKSSAQQPLYVLTPGAAEVFTEIFFEFATQYQPVPITVGGSITGWSLGRAAMSRSDLATYFRKRGAHSMETAMQRAIIQCSKYGRSSTLAGGPLAFGDEASMMSLQGFLLMMTDAAVENSRRVLRDLRMLELRHHFLHTHHPAMHLLPDLKIAFSRVVERLFAQAPNATLVLPGVTTAVSSVSIVSPSTPSYPQVLMSRSVEELVNIAPGSNQMSESLRTAAATTKAAALGSAAANGEGDATAATTTFSQEVILKLLNSQESFNRHAVAAKSKLAFLSQFILAPAVVIAASLPLKSPTAGLTPMLIHEVYAEDVASSLVGESSTKKHAMMIAGSTAESHAFSDALCTQRLSELFQRCIKEVAAQGVGSFVIYPESHPAMQQPAPKSLLATLAMLTGDRTPSSMEGGLSAASALFLCEKLFACALIKHNSLADECIAYARSLELYRLLSNNQTKNVRLLTSPGCPEWFRKVVRATARFVRTPILDIIRTHRERQQEEEKKRLESLEHKRKATSSISEAGTRERKEEEQEAPTPVVTAPPTPAAERNLNIRLEDIQSTTPTFSPSTPAVDVDSFPSEALYRALDRMIANAEFLLGSDLRQVMLGMGGSLPSSRAASKPASIKSSPMRGAGADMESTRLTVNRTPPPMGTSRGSDEEADIDEHEAEDSDEDALLAKQAQEDGGGLLLRRVQSDLFASPTRGAAAASLNQVTQFDLGAAASPNKPNLLVPPPQTTPTSARRLSDSDIHIQHALAMGQVDRPGTGSSEAGGLSSWTSTSLNVRAAPPPDADATEEESTTHVPFEAEWLARLMSSEQRLSDSIGASIQWLTSTMQNRMKLLQLLNSAFQAGHTQELVDDVLGLCRKVIRDIQASNSMRSAGQDTTQNVLLFFYQHLAQTLSRLDWHEAEVSVGVESTRPPEPLTLLQSRSTPLLRPASVYPPDASASASLTALQRQQLRQVSSRIRTILSIFSMEVSPNDSELLLGSGLLSVLPRFIFKLHQAQLQHQQFLHAQLYQPNASPSASPQTLSRSSSQGLSVSIGAMTSAPRASPSASSFWLTDEEVKLSTIGQNWSHQIFMYHCSSLLGLAPSPRTQQQRYVLAATLGRQLNSMVQDHLAKIQLAIATGFPFPTNATSFTQPIAARVRSEDMSEFGLFPLQLGNPLQAGLRELDELIYRTVDMLNLLQRISSQEHSVCSRKHILFLLRVLRHEDIGGGRSQVVLPSIIQKEIIKLLRRELTFHAPLSTHPNPPSAASSAVNSPVATTVRTPPFKSIFGLSSPSVSPPPSAPFLRTASLVAEDIAYSDVNLATELIDTVASMQAQQQLFQLAVKEQDTAEEAAREAQIDEIEQKAPSPMRVAAFNRSLSGSSFASMDSALASLDISSLTPASSTAVPPATPSKEQLRRASFRRVAVLLCPSCHFVEFPVCAQHKVFLTRQLEDGSAACPYEQCTSNTGSSAQWSRCMLCKKTKAQLSFWLISESEAAYCASAIKVHTRA
jgi:hypothetical protein